MLTLKVDPYNDELADDEDLLTSVDSKDPKRTAYVVRAVNAYAELVEIVRELSDLNYIADGDSDLEHRARRLILTLD